MDSEARWEPNAYVPAYGRRYLFAVAQSDDKSRFTVCAELDSDYLSESGEGELLFREGKPAPALQNALEFCRAYQNNGGPTEVSV